VLPKAIVFDLGKVLLDFDYNIAAGKIAARSKSTPLDIKKFIDHSSLLFRYETGLLTSKEFYAEICSGIGYGGDFDEFSLSFANIFEPITEMVQLQANLRRGGLPCYIFSNTNELAVTYIRQSYPFFSNFDDYILSYEHRAMKPDAALYQVVEQRSGRQGSEILYLDDRPENIAAGLARKWQAVLQESPRKTIEVLKQLGLPTDS
jgi:FMN phosphatase YigB (HAD superfamily)